MIRSLSFSRCAFSCSFRSLGRSPAFAQHAVRCFTAASADSASRITVSILGPPNAGKSTLFNRLMCKEANKSYRLQSDNKRRKGRSKGRLGSTTQPAAVGGAIVSSTPGTTRDRRECIGRIGGTTFVLMDTAGVDGERQDNSRRRRRRHGMNHDVSSSLDRAMLSQTLQAAQASDLVLLMSDGRVGVTADLMETARWLRKNMMVHHSAANDEQDDKQQPPPQQQQQTQRILLLANKLEGDRWAHDADSHVMEHLAEAARVGFGEAIPISAQHGEGLADIAVVIEEMTRAKRERLGLSAVHNHDDEKKEKEDDKEKPLQLAILGRQNVGKSTLVNALLEQERVIVGPTPGLTRDAIAIEWCWHGRPVKLVDTAGIRKISQRADSIEDMAVQDALRAMKVADVAVLVLDAEARVLTRQELAIADAVVKEGRALVVAANKMDLLVDAEYTAEQFASAVQEHIEIRLPILRRTPVVAMSSLTGERVHKLMPVVFDARDRWARVISTAVLNRWLSEVVQGHPPPMQQGKATKIKYIMQTKGRPPTFLLFCNCNELPPPYMRFLMRNFQDTFDLFGMEVRMAVKKSAENPFDKKTSTRGGFGLGGKDARRKRMVQELKTSGGKAKRKRKRRYHR